MEQNTLYRKYRPINFDQVVGQEHIVVALKNQILNDKLAHAYLFCGTRGTGKTTVAKILARAANCKNRKDANPCNECDICKSIFDNADLNVFEMDAAANNSINDIRKIRELVQYPPINDEKYKIFIIDEAHELSDAAGDAFLKTLEEPPEYVIFILATTEPSKLKSTILSRCQRYDFRRISIPDIISNLKNICDKENIDIEENALHFIAEKADGSMRESISILDRCNAFLTNETATLDKVKYILGIADDNVFSELTKALVKEDVKEALSLLDMSIKNGKEITVFVNDYIYYLRNLMIIKYLDKENDMLSITKEKFDELKKVSNNISIDTIIWYIERLSHISRIMKTDENKKVLLETTLIKLAVPETDYIEEAVMSRLATLEMKLKKQSYINVNNEEVKSEQTVEQNRTGERLRSPEAKNEQATEQNHSGKSVKSPEVKNKQVAEQNHSGESAKSPEAENEQAAEQNRSGESVKSPEAENEQATEQNRSGESAKSPEAKNPFDDDPFNEPAPPIVGDNVKLINTRWIEIISSFNRMTKALLKQSKIIKGADQKDDTVFLVVKNTIAYEVLNNKETKNKIEEAIENAINKKINIILKDAEKEHINLDDY